MRVVFSFVDYDAMCERNFGSANYASLRNGGRCHAIFGTIALPNWQGQVHEQYSKVRGCMKRRVKPTRTNRLRDPVCSKELSPLSMTEAIRVWTVLESILAIRYARKTPEYDHMRIKT